MLGGSLRLMGNRFGPPSAFAYWSTRLSKLVSQPLLLRIVRLEQVLTQLVTMVARWPPASCVFGVLCVPQLRLTRLLVVPPLNASTWTMRRGVTKVIEAEVMPGPL